MSQLASRESSDKHVLSSEPSMLGHTREGFSKAFLLVCRIETFNYTLSILRKTIEGYQNYFDFITFGIIIFKQIIFVIDRIITMLFTKMKN